MERTDQFREPARLLLGLGEPRLLRGGRHIRHRFRSLAGQGGHRDRQPLLAARGMGSKHGDHQRGGCRRSPSCQSKQ
jgi:hypothetical protein